MRETDLTVNTIERAARNVHTLVQNGRDEALDGDETQELADLFKLELDIHNGNITHGEYEEMRRLMFD